MFFLKPLIKLHNPLSDSRASYNRASTFVRSQIVFRQKRINFVTNGNHISLQSKILQLIRIGDASLNELPQLKVDLIIKF